MPFLKSLIGMKQKDATQKQNNLDIINFILKANPNGFAFFLNRVNNNLQLETLFL